MYNRQIKPNGSKRCFKRKRSEEYDLAEPSSKRPTWKEQVSRSRDRRKDSYLASGKPQRSRRDTGTKSSTAQKNTATDREENPAKYDLLLRFRSKKAEAAQEKGHCIYVTNFPQATKHMTRGDIEDMLQDIVQVPIVRFTFKGEGKIYAFVNVNPWDFAFALEKLNTIDFCGTRLKAAESNPRRGSSKKGSKLADLLHNIAKSNGITPCLEPKQMFLVESCFRTLYVANIPQRATVEHIEWLFEDFGKIEYAKMTFSSDPNKAHAGYAFVTFKDQKTAETALHATGAGEVCLFSTRLTVERSRPYESLYSLAYSAGLIDIDGNPSPMFVQLHWAAMNHMNAARPSFLQKQVVLQQKDGTLLTLPSALQPVSLPPMNAYQPRLPPLQSKVPLSVNVFPQYPPQISATLPHALNVAAAYGPLTPLNVGHNAVRMPLTSPQPPKSQTPRTSALSSSPKRVWSNGLVAQQRKQHGKVNFDGQKLIWC